MRRLIKLCAVAVLGAAFALASAPARAQDWSMLKGNQARTGRNALPALNGPGRTFLRWWRPNLFDDVGNTVLLDNTDLASIIISGVWGQPLTVADEANNAFLSDPNADPFLFPPYRYAFSTPSLDNTNPTIPQIPANHATWEWDVTPADAIPRNYALYVWLPIGPTGIAGIANFQSRFFVYEIRYGTGLVFYDVVDTFAAGTGWVRLGGGGRQNHTLFAFNGTNPIQIILHNTIPRDDANQLMDSVGNLVYADAVMAVPDVGYYNASPIVSQYGPGLTDISVIAALNRIESLGPNGEAGPQAEVVSYVFDASTGADNTRWRYAVNQQAGFPPTTVDNTDPAVIAGPGWISAVAPPVYQGFDYFSQPITNVLGAATSVAYAPILADGDYEIWLWLPFGGGLFGQHTRVEVVQGATVTALEVNQDRSNLNWVRLGGARYASTGANPLSLRITNFSVFPSDLGRLAFADAVRFVPAGGGVEVNSTPVQMTAAIRLVPAGVPTDTSVVLVAGEDGKLRCLDATGNFNGLTTAYWTYPSTPDPNNAGWTDPNQVAGEDGPGPTAEMPTSFDLSSALIQRIAGEDFLYIGSRNGRIYCVEMAGRGDFNSALAVPGTTTRKWTFPDDYPAPVKTSFLGPISGSVAFAIDSLARPTIYVPTSQGRLYALDAVGNANRTTNVRWTFPATNAPTLGEIVGTPVCEFGRVYFGTAGADGAPPTFYCLDDSTGATIWTFQGSPLWGATPTGDFVSGPITIPATAMIGTPDLVVVANDNGWITALDAATGVLIWTTDELGSNVIGNLSYTPQTVFDTLGVPVIRPCVIVPCADGRIGSLFAEIGAANIFGGRLAWGFDTSSGKMTASVAVGRSWMYAADGSGNLFGFNNNPAVITPGTPPGQEVIVPNDPAGIPFREAELVFITKASYEAMRLPSGSPGHFTYAQANNPANQIPSPPAPAYEWGETIYIMVYRFPFSLTANPVPPGLAPQAEFRINVEGSSVRNLTVRSKQFSAPGTAPLGGSGERLDGYAIISFTLQGSGSTAVPPGIAQASSTMSAQFSPGARTQNVALNPALSRKAFNVNNPLAVSVRFDAAGNPLAMYQLGHTIVRADPEAQVNGSPNFPLTAKLEDRLLVSPGIVAHNQTGNKVFGITDRSLMRLIRGPTRGLDQIRITMNNLAWAGGFGAVQKPIDQTLYPGIEDLPINFPNDSLDYPNISRDRVTIIKDKFGNAENPLLNAVSLLPPLASGPVFDPDTRILQVTPTEFEVHVPRFQPANLTQIGNSNPPELEYAGYNGRLLVFVDSQGNALLDRAGRREAFRSLIAGTSVDRDESLVVATPTVDLGSLAHGTGFRTDLTPYPWMQPQAPIIGFTPWQPTAYSSIFKSFVTQNAGNVNMRDLRLAKSTQEGANPRVPWGLFAPANHERSWLDTMFNLWSDIDATFAGVRNPLNLGYSRVVLQKARVGDPAPTELSVNTPRRDNINLGVTQGFYFDTAAFPPGPARVGVSVPIGFPVGTYITTLRVIEDELVPDEALQLTTLSGGILKPLEPYSDPGFSLRFTIRENRLTNTFSPLTAPMVHDLIAGGETFIHSSAQPAGMRDLNGNLVFAYTSTMGAFNQVQPLTERLSDDWRIYITTLMGISPSTATGPFGSSLLPDLNAWAPGGGGRYFRQENGPFPTTAPATLFSIGLGESILPNTVKFGAPGLPLLGNANPYGGAAHTLNYLTFIGEAQIQTPNGRRGASAPFIAAFTVAANGAVAMQAEHRFPTAEGGVKGHPSVVATANDEGTVFFAAGGIGQTQIYHVSYQYNGLGTYTETALRQMIVGPGFEALGAPSANARLYDGAPAPGLPTGAPMMEVSFTGKLRGRPHAEAFFARLRAGGAFGGPTGQLLQLPQVSNEKLTPDGETGVYRSLGVTWVPNTPVNLSQTFNGLTVNIEIANSRIVDGTTGLIQFDTVLGGKAYLDPSLGTVRFAGAIPARDAVLLLSYTPRVMRVSQGTGAGYSSPSGLFDNRMIGEFSYWARANNTALVPPGGPIPGDAVRSGRYVFLYGRAAAGAGQAARPYMRTFRLGVQLPTPIHTQAGGGVTSINVAGLPAGAFYQVDPANGRVYVTSDAENVPLTITYTGIDEATGGTIVGLVVIGPATMVLERNESPVAIEQAINEGQVYGFIDPFDHPDVSMRRPGLIWLFWMSTRAGGPDLYFQTVAPKFTPVPVGRG